MLQMLPQRLRSLSCGSRFNLRAAFLFALMAMLALPAASQRENRLFTANPRLTASTELVTLVPPLSFIEVNAYVLGVILSPDLSQIYGPQGDNTNIWSVDSSGVKLTSLTSHFGRQPVPRALTWEARLVANSLPMKLVSFEYLETNAGSHRISRGRS